MENESSSNFVVSFRLASWIKNIKYTHMSLCCSAFSAIKSIWDEISDISVLFLVQKKGLINTINYPFLQEENYIVNKPVSTK